MPLLRRRGNQATEQDTRRHTFFAPTTTDSEEPPSLPAPQLELHTDDDEQPLPQVQSRESTPPRPNTPPVQEESNRHRRFSLLRFRNASDSQLSVRAKQQAEKPPPVPRPPEIITTAPTGEFNGPKKKTSRMGLGTKIRRSHDVLREEDNSIPIPPRITMRRSFTEDRSRSSLAVLEEPPLPLPSQPATKMSSDGPVLQPPENRQSESSRSAASSTDPASQVSPNTTPKRAQATAPFFKFRRTKRAPEPMFPLGHLPQKSKSPDPSSSLTSLNTNATQRPSSAQDSAATLSEVGRTDNHQRVQVSPATALFASGESRSGQSSPTRANFLRGRSSTMSSMGRESNDEHLLPPTTRTSSSTGRKSFGDLLGLTRLRQNSELSRQGSITPVTPASIASKSNSLQLTREAVVLPEKREDESPAKYLARVEEVLSRGIIAATLSKGTDPFSSAVLRSYMRSFSFFGDPMDMAIRKLLMEAELPKETQQIDRCLQAFANRYHECNPGIYSSPDQAYFIAFSLLILHTDVFNKNNKYKMQKADYLKNTRGEGIFDDILECFYDNICYTPFIHVEEDLSINGDRNSTHRSKRKALLPTTSNDVARRAAREPIDPYTLILDGNLDALRPNLKDAMYLEDHYNYLGTAPSLNLRDLQKTFFRTGVLQIVSARSRPDAFMSEKTASNPQEAHPGIVDIKVTKVGLLWRKETKKRKTRSPWQEWGAILTGAQLYFFRNTSWVKNLMHQYEHHIKGGHDGIPIIFKPPLEEFKPDALMSTQGAVALLDLTYKKHKNAFVYVRQGGLDEVLLADNEEELNDWLAKLNYAAAFRTSGVKMRGTLGGSLDGQSRRGMRRLDSSDGTQLVQTPTGPVSIARGQIDRKMVEDIQSARREVMQQKIAEADKKVEESQKRLEEQLRNARHLQTLAPIQPRTREQLLSAAARMAAQLKWTRMEIWREKCHRDILAQDLSEDLPAAPNLTPGRQSLEQDRPTSSTGQLSISRTESKSTQSTQHRSPDKRPNPPELNLESIVKPEKTDEEVESPLDQVFQTPPQSASHLRQSSQDLQLSKFEIRAGRQRSISSITVSSAQSPATGSYVNRTISRDGLDRSSSKPEQNQDEIDAEEREFLRQQGLVEARESSNNPEKESVKDSDGADGSDKRKTRRSFQRTLREGAGHLSHHRSRKGKEGAAVGASDEESRDNMLARGTGSFVVHGKKASVINIGTELQSMTQDEKLRGRRQSNFNEQSPLSPMLSGDDEDDFHDALGPTAEDVEAEEVKERRESVASASTATARSFRELHRKYSTAQAVRSVSAGGRLTVPSDGESEAAVSFSDGRRTPLPPIETESIESADESRPETAERAEEGGSSEAPQEKSETHGEKTKGKETGDESLDDQDKLPSRPVQAVNA
ncbi:sec7-domain [Paramyrothecium foliicola]|nr:sec7-domain [Paramyrothecium foliicola]